MTIMTVLFPAMSTTFLSFHFKQGDEATKMQGVAECQRNWEKVIEEREDKRTKFKKTELSWHCI